MTTPLKRVQPAMAFAARNLDADVSLAALAEQAGLSTYHLHRLFVAASGETPKQFTLRLRLSRAAAMLLATRESVLEIALSCGFETHESFCRAFRRHFEMTPSEYRARGFVAGADSVEHAAFVRNTAPCIGLYRTPATPRPEMKDMTYSITKTQITPQPVLVVRRRIKPLEVAATLAEVLGQVFQYAQQNGIALAGQPFTRYIEWGPGVWTIEAGLPVTVHAPTTSATGDVRSDVLPGGFVATTTHTGPYEKLNEAHAAVQQSIEAEGLRPAGAPWEVYTTDPADFPDPNDWKTDIFWPVEA